MISGQGRDMGTFIKVITRSILTLIIPAIVFSNPIQNAQMIQNIYSIPLSFTQNDGQWPDSIRYRASAGGAAIWITPNAAYYQFTRSTVNDSNVGSTASKAIDRSRRGSDSYISDLDSSEIMMIKTSFINANSSPFVSGVRQEEYRSNYFLGNDRAKWRTNVPNYEAIILKEIYPGIDLTYCGNGSKIEYDFVVNPGADYLQIQMQFVGAEDVGVAFDGALAVTTKWGEFRELVPKVYQDIGGYRQTISAEYLINTDHSIGFRLGKEFDPGLPIVIDPVLVYSTYLGGSGQDYGLNIDVDTLGDAYVIGTTFSANFPTVNPLLGSYQAGIDVFVAKLSRAGNSLIYGTYLGGNSDELGWGIEVNTDGEVYLTGATSSADFPTSNPFQWALQGSSDVFVSKLSGTGDSLIFSTYLGGSAGDAGSSIVVDASGASYLTGSTRSTNFPTLNPYQEANHGGSDAFITKLSSAGNTLVYSTYLGGSESDESHAIAIDDSGFAYITGTTYSENMPIFGGNLETYQGNCDAFIAKFSIAGDRLIYSTYLGGGKFDVGASISVDGYGAAYVTGYTWSTNFPVRNPFQGTFQGPFQDGNGDAFVTKLSKTGGDLIYRTLSGRELR